MTPSTLRRERGFTLAETAIVVAIAGLVIAIGASTVGQYIEKSRLAQSILDVSDMTKTIRQFEMSTGAIPNTLADVALDTKLDPWGRPYQYLNLRTIKNNILARKDKKLKPLNSDFDLYSMGPDGQTQPSLLNAVSRDDVIRARDGSYIGTAEEFDP